MLAFLQIKAMSSTVDFAQSTKEFIDKMCLVLVGPDPRGVSDDPEASEVLNELIQIYVGVEDKSSIAIIVLNIENREENHQTINALQ